MCAALRVPLAPAVGVVPLCLVPWCHRVPCDACWLDACTAAWLVGLPSVARVVLLACVGGLAFVVCACGGFLLAYEFLTTTSLCNTPMMLSHRTHHTEHKPCYQDMPIASPNHTHTAFNTTTATSRL